MGGGPQNMQAMIRQTQKMQEDMAAKQEELEAREYDISAGGGVVNVKINGKKEILSVKLAPEIVDPDDIETLEDLVVAAVNEAIKKVESTAASEMQQITGSVGLSGIPGMF
jgi:DNA-binding YbaB/EbfC family protein